MQAAALASIDALAPAAEKARESTSLSLTEALAAVAAAARAAYDSRARGVDAVAAAVGQGAHEVAQGLEREA